MEFKKLGLIFEPDTRISWQYSHAALPTALKLSEGHYRIFFTSRDKENKTYVGSFEWRPDEPEKAFNITKDPVLSPGELGMFDSFGVQATSLVKKNDDIYMYYLGWVIGKPEPLFYTAIGLAISKDGGRTFQKISPAPIMERSEFDPWMVSGGTVLKNDLGWRMYYISGISFSFRNGEAESIYDVKLAESEDGIKWFRKGITPFPLGEEETNISRITFLYEDGKLKAWFPVKKRGRGYACGYAESADGISFIRNDANAGIGVSGSGWDSRSIDKMEVIKHKDTLYMFYNGNSFGKDGIGLAIGSSA